MASKLKKEGLERILSQLGVSETDKLFAGRVDRLVKTGFASSAKPMWDSTFRDYEVRLGRRAATHDDILATLKREGFDKPYDVHRKSRSRPYLAVYYRIDKNHYRLHFHQPS